MRSDQGGADSMSLSCGSTLLALVLAGLTAGTAQADLAAELERLSQVHVAEFGRDALVREYGKALVRHPEDRGRSAALLAMGHLCANHDPAHGFVHDHPRARRYYRAAIAAAPVGTEAWLEASLTSFSREIWCDKELVTRQLADLELQFAAPAYYDPDWRRVAAVQVAEARVRFASHFQDVFATLEAFRSLQRCERSVRPVEDIWQIHKIIVARDAAYSLILGKIVWCDLPKARRRELLEPFRNFRPMGPHDSDFRWAWDQLEALPEDWRRESGVPTGL